MLGLRPQALLLLTQFRRERRTEILRTEDGPDLDFDPAVERRLLQPFDRVVDGRRDAIVDLLQRLMT